MVKVSVIVPVYNVEKYIDKCLDSLVNQSLDDIEVIVVNDGSKDNSQDIIDRYVEKYPKKVKSFKKENGGVSSARNYGLKHAAGEYIGFVDSDDWIDKDMYKKMYDLAAKEKADIAICDILKVFPNEKTELYKCNYGLTDDVVKSYIIGDSGPCAKMFKKEICKKLVFRDIYYEDLDVLPTLVLYTNKITYLDEALYFYRQVEGSATRQTRFSRKLLDIFTVLENVEKKLYEKYPLEVEYLYTCHLLRTTSLRLASLRKADKYLNRVSDTMHKKFPNYSKNIYYKKSSKKMKVICFLAYHRCWSILKIIKKVTNK